MPVSIRVENESQERNALNFIDEAEKHETVKSSEIKAHSPGYKEILDILCKTYEKEARTPCPLPVYAFQSPCVSHGALMGFPAFPQIP